MSCSLKNDLRFLASEFRMLHDEYASKAKDCDCEFLRGHFSGRFGAYGCASDLIEEMLENEKKSR